jgi:hypothetical protein
MPFTTLVSHHVDSPGLPAMIQFNMKLEGLFIWNFEFDHWDLFESRFLVLGLRRAQPCRIFIILNEQVMLAKSVNYAFK